MTEISLRLDRLAELIQANFLLVAAVVAAWLALTVFAVMRGGARWRPTRPLAVLGAIASSVSTLFMAPRLMGLSFGAVANWADWISLLAVALGSGLITFAFAWPAAATALRERR